MKKIASFILCFAVMAYIPCICASAYSAQCCVLYDPDSKEVLCGSNYKMRHSMASTTKIMTALLLCEFGGLNRLVKVNPKAVLVEGTSVGLRANDVIPRENLLYGLMLESGNDAANAIAYELSGGISQFADLMNKKAKQLHLNGTHFVTPSGLDDKQHYTTALDMAVLAAYAMKNSEFRKAVGTKKYRSIYNNESTVRTYSNHNRLLREMDGAEGVKTGFTKKSGRCLVSSCTRMDKRLICVTLNAPDDWNDHKQMFNYGFSLYEKISLKKDISLKNMAVAGGTEDNVSLSVKSVEATVKKERSGQINYVVNLPQFVYAPVLCGEKIGTVDYYCNGKKIAESSITADNAVYPTLPSEPGKLECFFGWLKILIKLG